MSRRGKNTKIVNKDKCESLRKTYSDRVWKTKKARINAANRLLDNYWFVQIATISFSVLLILLTLISYKQDDLRSLLLLGTTITVTIFNVYGTSKNYQERHIRMKDNYIKIGRIESKLLGLDFDTNIKNDLDKLIEDYQNMLDEAENHETVDYLILQKELNDSDSQNSNRRYKLPKGYIYHKIKHYFPRVLVVIAWISVLVLFVITPS